MKRNSAILCFNLLLNLRDMRGLFQNCRRNTDSIFKVHKDHAVKANPDAGVGRGGKY